MYAEVYLTLLTCCFSIDIYSFLYRTRVITSDIAEISEAMNKLEPEHLILSP